MHYEWSFERLARYAGRPPLATERLSQLPDGRLLYRLKRRWRDGTSHVIYEPLELMERLAALVHPPRFNITRFYGIFSPGANLRPRLIPEAEGSTPPQHPACRSGVEAPADEHGKTKKKRSHQPRNYPWAVLMARVLELDVLACPHCRGRLRILAAIDTPDAIHEILESTKFCRCCFGKSLSIKHRFSTAVCRVRISQSNRCQLPMVTRRPKRRFRSQSASRSGKAHQEKKSEGDRPAWLSFSDLACRKAGIVMWQHADTCQR
jgi:uncharacterized protein YbaR (Trm112 family)